MNDYKGGMSVPDVVHVRELEQARALLHPIRVAVLQRLREPHTCADLAKALGMTAQRMNHHVKALVEAGLVRVVREERVRNLMRATYQAVGKVVWLSPSIARDPSIDERAERDRMSLHALLEMAETVQDEVAALLSRTSSAEVPSLGLNVEVHLRDEAHRKAFAKDVLDALAPVIRQYQGPAADAGPFRLTLMCYPEEAADG